MDDQAKRLTAGRLLARNTVWSLLGSGVPLLVAAASIPVLIKGLGTERFGLLSIIWVVIGYFSVFDLGLGRALTQLVAERLGGGKGEDIPHLTKTALAVIGFLGVGAAAVVVWVSPWLVTRVLKVRGALGADGTHAFWVLALSLPFIILSGGLIGLLQAHQKFRAISAVRMVTGSLTFLGPVIALHWTNSLTAAAAALAASRILANGAYVLLCVRAFPLIWREGRFRRSLLRPLIRFGSWFTVDNIIGPFVIYMDRFVIGMLLGLTAVTYYATPYEVVTRLSVLPVAFVSVLFPAFATTLTADRDRVPALFGRACRVVILAMLPLIALIALFAPEILSAWVGHTLAVHSAVVLRWLAVGVLINSVARLPHALIQGAGRPDLVAKLHFVEVPIYLAVLWFLLGVYGIEGAAIAWTLRVGFDTLALFWLGGRLVPSVQALSLRVMATIGIVCCGVGLLTLTPGVALKVGSSTVLVAGVLFLAYREARSAGWKLRATSTRA